MFQNNIIDSKKRILIHYLKFSSTNIKGLENEIIKLNFNNPFSIIFIHETLKAIFIEKNNKVSIVDTINKRYTNI